jgi:hypothetical protein
MSASLLHRSAALAAAFVVAFVGAVVLGGGTATAAPEPDSANTASAPALRADWVEYDVYRESGNKCGWARFHYRYRAQGDGYYYIQVKEGTFGWRSDRAGCGTWGKPYSVVLQWKAERNCCFGDFDWTDFHYGVDPTVVFEDWEGPDLRNVRFRVCNMNNTTSFIGTCGTD